MTGRLLAFSRSSQSESGTCDMSSELFALKDLLVPLVRDDVVFSLDVPPDLAVVPLSSSELGQVVINLVSNALDAMPEGGCLEVRALPSGPPHEAPPGDWILLEALETLAGTNSTMEPLA